MEISKSKLCKIHDNSKPALEVTAYNSFSFRVLARL